MGSCGPPLAPCLLHPSLFYQIFLGRWTQADLSPQKSLPSIINIYVWPGHTYRPLLQHFWIERAEGKGGKRKRRKGREGEGRGRREERNRRKKRKEMRRQEGRRETGAKSFFVASIQVDPWSPSPGSTKGPRTHIKLLIVLFITGRNPCIPVRRDS